MCLQGATASKIQKITSLCLRFACPEDILRRHASMFASLDFWKSLSSPNSCCSCLCFREAIEWCVFNNLKKMKKAFDSKMVQCLRSERFCEMLESPSWPWMWSNLEIKQSEPLPNQNRDICSSVPCQIDGVSRRRLASDCSEQIKCFQDAGNSRRKRTQLEIPDSLPNTHINKNLEYIMLSYIVLCLCLHRYTLLWRKR